VELLWLIGNYRRMKLFYDATCRVLHKWLNRRSQRRSLTWPAFNRMLARFQMPPPRIVEKNGQRMPCQLELSFCHGCWISCGRGRARRRMRERVNVKSPVREYCSPGSVRGTSGNQCPYLDKRGGCVGGQRADGGRGRERSLTRREVSERVRYSINKNSGL